jgi:hypothetical protein
MSGPSPAEAARAALALGLCVLPPKEDGSKMPIVEQDSKTKEWGWKQWQKERPTPLKVEHWYSGFRTALGLVCGRISRNLELLDFDDRATYDRFKTAAIAIGLGDLVERIEAGYLEETPNGTHWFYRCSEIQGNQKLARRLKRPDEQHHASDTIKGLIETRGEGGYAVIAPSNGKVHPSGRAYQRLRGELATIATITPDERAELFQLARTFDELPRPEAREPAPATPRTAQDGLRPGDVFNARADWAADVLQPNGWTYVGQDGSGTQFWRRPGSTHRWSATLNYQGRDLLHVYTTSTALNPERSYSKFTAFSILTHNGDFSAAARTAADRFGLKQTAKAPTRPAEGTTLQQIEASGSDGAEMICIPRAEFDRLQARDQRLDQVEKIIANPGLKPGPKLLGVTAIVELERREDWGTSKVEMAIGLPAGFRCVSRARLAAAAGMSEDSVDRHMDTLQALGVVEHRTAGLPRGRPDVVTGKPLDRPQRFTGIRLLTPADVALARLATATVKPKPTVKPEPGTCRGHPRAGTVLKARKSLHCEVCNDQLAQSPQIAVTSEEAPLSTIPPIGKPQIAETRAVSRQERQAGLLTVDIQRDNENAAAIAEGFTKLYERANGRAAPPPDDEQVWWARQASTNWTELDQGHRPFAVAGGSE